MLVIVDVAVQVILYFSFCVVLKKSTASPVQCPCIEFVMQVINSDWIEQSDESLFSDWEFCIVFLAHSDIPFATCSFERHSINDNRSCFLEQTFLNSSLVFSSDGLYDTICESEEHPATFWGL